MSRVLRLCGLLSIVVCAVNAASAGPITYNAQLSNGVPEVGSISPTNTSNNPVGAQYYSFFATAGSPITITGARLENDYDMSFWVFQGLFADTNQFGSEFDSGDAGFIDFADDEIPHPGPFSDPQSQFNAPVTGFYTVAVTNFASGLDAGPNGLFEFQLTATGIQNVPEPASIAVWTMLLLTVAGACCYLQRKAPTTALD